MPTNFMLMPSYQLARTKAEPVCTMWKMPVSTVVINREEAHAKRWVPQTATGTSLATCPDARDWH